MRYTILSNDGVAGVEPNCPVGVFDTCGMNGGIEIEAITDALNHQWEADGYEFAWELIAE